MRFRGRDFAKFMLCACCLLLASWATASDTLRVERLPGSGEPLPFEQARSRGQGWRSAPARVTGPSWRGGAAWWRIKIVDPAAESDPGRWVLNLREVFDARLIVYLPPDYSARRMSLFDPELKQIGSRHRLAIDLSPEQRRQPIYLQVEWSRQQPMALAAEPLAAYVEGDLSRVRFTSAMLASMLLLAVVGAIFAFALKRRILLLFCVWILSSAVYLAALSGELLSLLGAGFGGAVPLLVGGIATHVGLIAAYVFVHGFLDIGRHFPRLSRLFRLLLWIVAVLTLGTVATGAASTLSLALNVILLALVGLALGMALRLALLGHQQARFYLLGWGLVALGGMARAAYFIARSGTPVWLEYAHPALNTLGALVLVLATARAARYAEREMHNARLSARTDPLTGLPNRAELDSGLPARVERAINQQQPMCLLFIDLDHFKRINDRYGHDVGDHCLVAAAKSLRRHVRVSDLLARYGGEEFVLMLERTALADAQKIAAALRASVELDGLEVQGHRVCMTVSIGIAQLAPGESASELLRRADEALYLAKSRGRNRFVPELPHSTAA